MKGQPPRQGSRLLNSFINCDHDKHAMFQSSCSRAERLSKVKGLFRWQKAENNKGWTMNGMYCFYKDGICKGVSYFIFIVDKFMVS